MERYEFSAQAKAQLEKLKIPLAVYQFIDRRVVTLVLSDGFCEVFGYSDRKTACHDMDHDMYKDVHPDDVSRIADAALHFATEDGRYDEIYRTWNREDETYHIIHAVGKHFYTETGVRLAQISYLDEGRYTGEMTPDVGSWLNGSLNNALYEESIARASYYDHLTGLPSMAYFLELVAAGRERVMKEGGKPVLLFMDLSGMKYFNTRYGFSEGDKLLRAFAKVLVKLFSNENCCHVGADHFAAFTREEGLEDALRTLYRDCRQINEGNSIPVHVGVYIGGQDGVPASEALDRAKIACDSMRRTYESGAHYYSHQMREEEDLRQHILSNIDRAIEEKWIQVYYQPIVRAVNGRVSDEEALARWIDPEKGFLSPARFIPYLEDAKLIYRLDLYVLDQVLKKIKILEANGLYIVPQSINLSRSDFETCDIVEEIRSRVDAAGIGHDKITIEITESTIGSDFEFMKKQVSRFQELGFAVWMDDFGSGYSSFDVLQSIRFDLVKFDMSFMKKLDQGENGKVILTQLMKLTTALGLDSVCEGVETIEQVRFLQEIGCSKLQGFYYVRPIPLETVLARYETGKQIGFENPAEAGYNEAIGRMNLQDYVVLPAGMEVMEESGDASYNNVLGTVPAGIMEVKDGRAAYVRTNSTYREFMKKYFDFDIDVEKEAPSDRMVTMNTAFMSMVRQCCSTGKRMFLDEQMQDGTMVHSMVQKIAENPVNGKIAVIIVVLSVTPPVEGTTYANIARALAMDYYNIYYVDLKTERFIEYRSKPGGEELAMERHGTDFFAEARHDAMTRIHEEDREPFVNRFTKENVLRELDERGVAIRHYRLIETGEPMEVSMKISRMQPLGRFLIIGVSIREWNARFT